MVLILSFSSFLVILDADPSSCSLQLLRQMTIEVRLPFPSRFISSPLADASDLRSGSLLSTRLTSFSSRAGYTPSTSSAPPYTHLRSRSPSFVHPRASLSDLTSTSHVLRGRALSRKQVARGESSTNKQEQWIIGEGGQRMRKRHCEAAMRTT